MKRTRNAERNLGTWNGGINVCFQGGEDLDWNGDVVPRRPRGRIDPRLAVEEMAHGRAIILTKG